MKAKEVNMKKLIFIHGPNGVGKSTLCSSLNKSLYNSAWLESEWCRMTNPFTFTDEVIELTINNMAHMLKSYLTCSSIEYIIFNYGFHGPRRNIYDKVIQDISEIQFKFIPILITCSEEENIKRMLRDGRDKERIERALSARSIYDGSEALTIDTTELTVEMTINKLMEIIKS